MPGQTDRQIDAQTERQSKLQLNANAVINFRSGFDDDDEQDEAMAMALVLAKASPARHLNGKSLPGWLWKLVAARDLDSLQ